MNEILHAQMEALLRVEASGEGGEWPPDLPATMARQTLALLDENQRLTEAARIAEAALHSWSVLNTRTDPRESQRMGRQALERFRAALAVVGAALNDPETGGATEGESGDKEPGE